MTRKTQTTLSMVAVVVLIVAAGCSSLRSGTSANKGPSTRAVAIHTFRFRPSPLTITAGTTVRWTNRDQILHTVTSGTREYDPTNSGKVTDEHTSGQFDAPLDGVSSSFAYRFRSAGTFHYFCSRHPGMEADVTVT